MLRRVRLPPEGFSTRCAGFVKLGNVSVSQVIVSAVIPVLNGEAYVAEAIKSVLAQTFQSLECIVVDNGSTDGTVDVLGAFSGRVTFLRQVGGVAAARNAGARAARARRAISRPAAPRATTWPFLTPTICGSRQKLSARWRSSKPGQSWGWSTAGFAPSTMTAAASPQSLHPTRQLPCGTRYWTSPRTCALLRPASSHAICFSPLVDSMSVWRKRRTVTSYGDLLSGFQSRLSQSLSRGTGGISARATNATYFSANVSGRVF